MRKSFSNTYCKQNNFALLKYAILFSVGKRQYQLSFFYWIAEIMPYTANTCNFSLNPLQIKTKILLTLLKLSICRKQISLLSKGFWKYNIYLINKLVWIDWCLIVLQWMHLSLFIKAKCKSYIQQTS